MSEKNRKKRQEQDLITKRILAIFLVTVVLLWGMSSLYDLMTYGSTFMQGQLVNNGVMAVSGLAALVSLVMYFTAKKKSSPTDPTDGISKEETDKETNEESAPTVDETVGETSETNENGEEADN